MRCGRLSAASGSLPGNLASASVTAVVWPGVSVKKQDILWITWQRHRRSRELAAALGADLHEVISSRARPWKYVPLVLRTTLLCLRRRPSLVFVQCPSIFLAMLAACLRPLLRYRLVCDLHNEAIRPFLHNTTLQKGLLRWIWRSADLNFVTNEGLKDTVERAGGSAFVLPDRIPKGIAAAGTRTTASAAATVVFVCTYEADEPFREVIEAGRLLPATVHTYVTGNYTRVRDLPEVPPNVHLTGFLPDAEYENLLNRADVIVDLTAMEDCLVCGGYEAAAVGKPFVTSDTAALRNYFHSGTLYTIHSQAAIADAIRRALDNRDPLAREMCRLRVELDEDWEKRRHSLDAELRLRPG